MAKCHQCATKFDATRVTQKYCCADCRRAAKNDRLRIKRKSKDLAKLLNSYIEKREWLGCSEQVVSEHVMLIVGSGEALLDLLSYNEIMFDAIDMEGMNQ